MPEKYNESTPQRPKGARPLDGPLITFDLETFMVQIKQEKAWLETDRNAITVYKTAGMTIVLVALHKGAEMKKHIAGGIISVQVLEGRIRFETEQESVGMPKGQMLTLHERIPHSVWAMEESVFLLTHAKPSGESLDQSP